jgi:hypothetical protein
MAYRDDLKEFLAERFSEYRSTAAVSMRSGLAVAVLFDRLPGIISSVEAELAKAEA